MKINVEYYAALREQSQLSDEQLDTSASTVAELYETLKQKHNFRLERQHLKVAINERYADFNTVLNDSDTVVFIPPVAGG